MRERESECIEPWKLGREIFFFFFQICRVHQFDREREGRNRKIFFFFEMKKKKKKERIAKEKEEEEERKKMLKKKIVEEERRRRKKKKVERERERERESFRELMCGKVVGPCMGKGNNNKKCEKKLF